MSEHRATITWTRTGEDFSYPAYDRGHQVRFEGGTEIKASSAKEYLGDPALVNPEELLVAALSNCHMLTFLAIASRKRFVVDAYVDEAVGQMTKNENGKMWVSHVTLRPCITFGGDKKPTAEEVEHMHHSSHENCFIALSVKTEVVIEGTIV